MKLKYSKNITTLVSCLVLINILFLILLFRGNQARPHFDNSGNFSEVEELKGKNMDFKQLSVFFTKLAESKGGEYGYKSLALATARSYLPANIDTHLLGHVVGDVLFKQQGVAGMQVCTDDLRNACSHSIVVGSLLERGPETLREIVKTCKLAPGGRGAYTMCIHGLGHGVLAYTEYDMAKAIDLCKTIVNPDQYRSREFIECTGGTAMEMMAGVNDREAWEKQKPNYFSDTDPLAPCNMKFMPVEAQPICYNFLTPHLFQAAGADLQHPTPEHYEKAFMFCDRIPKEQQENRDLCFAGFGKEFVVLVNDRNVQVVENMDDTKLKTVYAWCKLAKEQYGIKPCINSALQSLFWGGENSRSASLHFCGLINPEDDKKFCFDNLIWAVSYYITDPGYKKEFCLELPGDYQSDCRSRLNIQA